MVKTRSNVWALPNIWSSIRRGGSKPEGMFECEDDDRVWDSLSLSLILRRMTMIRSSVGLWLRLKPTLLTPPQLSLESASGIKRRPPRQSNPASRQPHICLTNTATLISWCSPSFQPDLCQWPVQVEFALLLKTGGGGVVNLAAACLGLFAKPCQGCGAPLRPHLSHYQHHLIYHHLTPAECQHHCEVNM